MLIQAQLLTTLVDFSQQKFPMRLMKEKGLHTNISDIDGQYH